MKKQTDLPAAVRKLSLNKKTISNLQPSEMEKKVGGTTYFGPCGCPQKTKNGKTCPGHNTCNVC